MPFLSKDGVSLRYDRAGGGPAVLLIHGWTCNRSFWERQVQALRTRHTVIAVDLRGHGESSHPRTGYSLGALVRDLDHLVRALAVPRIALVGWSMGGMVALDLARRLGERASALVLVGTTAGGLTDDKNALHLDPTLLATTQKALQADCRAYLRSYAPSLFKLGAESPLLAWAAGQMQKTPAHAVEACLDGLLAFDARATLGGLSLPTAVLHGRHDAVFPLAHGEALATGIAGARLTVFEDSGHAPPLEEPERFNDTLAALLAA